MCLLFKVSLFPIHAFIMIVRYSGVLILLILGNKVSKVMSSLLELVNLHALSLVPVDIGLGSEHLVEVGQQVIEALVDQSRIAQEGTTDVGGVPGC